MSSFSLAKRIQCRDLLLDRRPRAGTDRVYTYARLFGYVEFFDG